MYKLMINQKKTKKKISTMEVKC